MGTPTLNRRIALQEPVRIPDGAGGWSVEWLTLGALWAEITPGRGRELTVATLDVARVSMTVTVRAAPPGDDRRPRPDQRFLDGARVLRILAVREISTDARYLACVVEEERVS